MAYPKVRPCPKCGEGCALIVTSYDSGNRYVECDGCHYRGPGAFNIPDAIKLHNKCSDEAALARRLSELAREFNQAGRHDPGGLVARRIEEFGRLVAGKLAVDLARG